MRRKLDIDTMYAGHSNLITSRAASWAERTGRDFSDLFGVCEEAFVECFVVFDPDRGAKFASMLALICNQKLGKFCRKFDTPRELPWESEEGSVEPPARESSDTVERWISFKEGLDSEARAILEALLSDPQAIVEGAHSMCKTKLLASARKLLLEQGFPEEQIDSAFEMMKSKLAEAHV